MIKRRGLLFSGPYIFTSRTEKSSCLADVVSDHHIRILQLDDVVKMGLWAMWVTLS